MIDTLLFHVRCFGLFHRWASNLSAGRKVCTRCGWGAPRW